jgi:repressor LexA
VSRGNPEKRLFLVIVSGIIIIEKTILYLPPNEKGLPRNRKEGAMEKVTTLGQRLHDIMREQELSYEQFGKLLEMRPQTLNRYVLGQREPRAEVAMDMAMRLGVNLYWLQGYNAPRKPDPEQPGDPEQIVLPILGSIRAGIPTLAQQEVEGYAAADVPDPERCFYLRVEGDSMINAGIRPGDLVLIRQQKEASNGQIVACIVNHEDATLKRFHRHGDVVLLQPENPEYEPRILSASQFDTGEAMLVGVAVKLVRDL